MNEFELIQRFFSRQVPDKLIGVGDDCAYLPLDASTLAVSKDLLLEHQHFFSDMDPRRLGHKSLAVNLSDLAAAGARPLGCFLGLGLPGSDPDWVHAFSEGFCSLSQEHGCPLLGGDTTRSSRDKVISVTVLGTVAAGAALPLRRAAIQGDDVWVSGTLGGASLALSLLFKAQQQTLSDAERRLLNRCRDSFEMPRPQNELGMRLRPHVHAMIDVSDGLLQDLNHILQASACGAVLWAGCLPVHEALLDLSPESQRRHALGGGEDYQLCFTAPEDERRNIVKLAEQLRCPITRIGYINAHGGSMRVLDPAGQEVQPLPKGFDHFSE